MSEVRELRRSSNDHRYLTVIRCQHESTRGRQSETHCLVVRRGFRPVCFTVPLLSTVVDLRFFMHATISAIARGATSQISSVFFRF